MKRKITKFNLHKKGVEVACDLHFYQDGTIVFEDYTKQDYYVFSTLVGALEFIKMNYDEV